MNYLILFLFVLGFAPINTVPTKTTHQYLPFAIKSQNLSPAIKELYKSSVTGDKTNLPKKIKTIFKRYGLMHLLTPSGLHFSSLFFLNFLPNYLLIIVLICCYYFLHTYESYLALERVIIFKILFQMQKKFQIQMHIEIIFLITLIVSILLGNYQQNPTSFFFSAFFWGTILIFRENKFRMFLFTNLSLHFTALLFNQNISILSLLINPIFTAIFVFIFPLLTINYICGGVSLLNLLIDYYLKYYVLFLKAVDAVDIFPNLQLGFYSLTIFMGLILLKRLKTALLLISLFGLTTNSTKQIISPHKTIINLAHPQELISQKKGSLNFVFQKCKIDETKIKCKKKPSYLGGPNFN